MFGNRKIWAAVVLTVGSNANAQTPPLEVIQHAELHATLKVAGFSAPVELRQSGRSLRVDMAGQSYIADRDKGVLMVITGKTALVFPLARAEAIVPLPIDLSVITKTAAVKPVGASIVDGRSCKLMEFSGYLGQSGMICVDPGNVILQMTKRGKTEPLFEVTALELGPQDPQWFRKPADVQAAVVPGIGGASAASEDASR